MGQYLFRRMNNNAPLIIVAHMRFHVRKKHGKNKKRQGKTTIII